MCIYYLTFTQLLSVFQWHFNSGYNIFSSNRECVFVSLLGLNYCCMVFQRASDCWDILKTSSLMRTIFLFKIWLCKCVYKCAFSWRSDMKGLHEDKLAIFLNKFFIWSGCTIRYNGICVHISFMDLEWWHNISKHIKEQSWVYLQ